MDPDIERLAESLPPIDERARAANLAMTNANYAFLGGEVAWARSARFSQFFHLDIPTGTILRVTYHEAAFQGRLARRLCLWGDEEYLECPLPKDFATLVAGPLRRAVDVATNVDGQLVMTFTPGGDGVERGKTALDRLSLARDLEILAAPEPPDGAAQRAMNDCSHDRREEVHPDPSDAFLERIFTVCRDCGKVLQRRGSCARDGCDCSRHHADFIRIPVAAG
ncbi:MAG: hypothetical protein GX442_06990 [Candidatus Riflebacteria bacterium]|nr:hypothetical protein [Candidatus Riflebacteria bacterium]